MVVFSWAKFFEENKNTLDKIENKVKEEIDSGYTILPEWVDIYKAFHLSEYNKTKVVIIGQDPYPTSDNAMGLAFSTGNGSIPRSLNNIYKELERDPEVEFKRPSHGDLTKWAKQGVLLLNCVLTVRRANAGSHIDSIGWQEFTNEVIKELSTKGNVVFMLWGNEAKSKQLLIDHSINLVLKTSHPSPLSARKGFNGCQHFSKANSYLSRHNKKQIDWTLD